MNESLSVEPPPGRYLITGGSGFIGSRLRQRVLAAGGEVLLLDLAPPTVMSDRVEYIRCDLTDAAAVKRALRDARIDHVLHAAARVGDFGSYDDFAGINVTGTRNVLDAALAAGAKSVVHLSSIAAMGLKTPEGADHRVDPITEGDPYSLTKAEGERVARSFQREGVPVIVVRPGDVYGVGSVPWVVRPVAMMKKRQLVLIDGGRGHFAHTHVDNLLDACLLAMANPEALGKVLVVTDGDNHCTMRDYFTRLANAVGLPPPTVSLPKRAALVLARGIEAAAKATHTTPPFTPTAVNFMLREGSFSIEHAKQLLGWAPRVTLDEGLAAIGRAMGGAR